LTFLLLLVAVVLVAIPAQVGLVDYFRKQQEVLRQQRRTQSRLALEEQHQHPVLQIKVQTVLILFLIPQPHLVAGVGVATVIQPDKALLLEMVKTVALVVAAAILLLWQQLALAVPPRKATAAALRVMVTLAVMGILTR
jgi:hypothetical protein